MSQENENLLAVLKAELAFVESGGYSTPKEATWRPHFIFQDSPTCLNFRNRDNRLPCSKCALIQLVPKNRQRERFPCRYIPLDEFGQNLDFLYRTGTEEETYNILANWLRTNIVRLGRKSDSPVSGKLSEELVPVGGNPR